MTAFKSRMNSKYASTSYILSSFSSRQMTILIELVKGGIKGWLSMDGMLMDNEYLDGWYLIIDGWYFNGSWYLNGYHNEWYVNGWVVSWFNLDGSYLFDGSYLNGWYLEVITENCILMDGILNGSRYRNISITMNGMWMGGISIQSRWIISRQWIKSEWTVPRGYHWKLHLPTGVEVCSIVKLIWRYGGGATAWD